jgi:hypothetical protein
MRKGWAGHVACLEEKRNVYRFWVWKSEGKRQLGIQRHRWEYNIKKNIEDRIGESRLDCDIKLW